MNGFRPKRKATAAVLLIVVGLLVWELLLPMVTFSRARKKYAIGMSLEEVQKIAIPPFATHFDIAYPVDPEWNGEMPEFARKTVVVGLVHCPRECVQLGFNSYSNLVEIMPVNDPIDLRLWLKSRKR